MICYTSRTLTEHLGTWREGGEGPRDREGELCQALYNILTASQGGGDCVKITGGETEAQTTSQLAVLRFKSRNRDC